MRDRPDCARRSVHQNSVDQSHEDLATRFPENTRDAAWRAGELYAKRLKNADKARACYALVPQQSSHYRDAQKKATS